MPFPKDNLLRGMLELLIREPATMRQRPMAASAINPAVPPQRGKQLLPFAAIPILGRVGRRSR